MIRIARPLYARDPIGVDLDQTLYALDSVPLAVPVGQVPPAQGCCEDAHAAGPARQHFIRITDGKTHDVNILDEIGPEPGAFYVIRAYVDFERLFVFTLCSSFFVVRTKKNILLQRRYSHPVDRSTGVRIRQRHRIGPSVSLSAALQIAGFKQVDVSYFYQLPFLWRYPFLKPIAWTIASLPLPYRPYQTAPWQESCNKLIRFSKEVMLLGVGSKSES